MSRLGVLCVAVFCCMSASTIDAAGEDLGGCTPYKSMLSEAVITISASYFADNPRNNEDPIDPNRIKPFTPDGLFRTYYGQGVSAEGFQSAVLSMLYIDFDINGKKEDRIKMRRDIALYISAGSFVLARERMGKLLFSVTGDYAGGSPDWTERGCLPQVQVKEAKAALAIEFAKLRNEVGDLRFGQFLALGTGKTLAFVIDDTGSMGTEIEGAKTRVKIIINHLQKSLDRPQDFVLVPFNDPEVGPLTATTDAALFTSAIDRLHAHGGGDQPEMCMRGIQLAIENSRPGSTLYVITDVHAKDYPLQDTVISQAVQKGISVVFMLTNSLTYCQPIRKIRYDTCIQLYRKIAAETGGKVLVVSKNHFFRATEIVETGLKQGLVILKKISLKGSRGSNRHIQVDVDSTVSELLVEAQGECGSPYLSHGSIRQDLTQIGNLYSTTIVVNKQHGRWTIAVGQVDRCDIKILGKSTFGFVLNPFVATGDSGLYANKKLVGHPSNDQNLALFLDAYGVHRNGSDPSDRVTSVRLLDDHGRKELDVLPFDQDLSVDALVHLYQRADMPRAGEPFFVEVKGIDRNGRNFSRVFPRLFSTSHVAVTCDLSGIVFRPGVSIVVNVSVTNNGLNDTFVVSVSDPNGFASLVGKPQRNIESNETKIIQLRLFAKATEKDGVASPITVTVKGKHGGSFQYGSCTAVVGQKKRPRIDSLSVTGVINARFAETVVTSVVINNADIGREAEFDVILPSDAFIVNMTMKLHNETILGEVQEKKKAKKIYDRAKKEGKAAGHVAAREKSTRVYRTSMFVEPRRNVTFQLTYQQLLKRVRGKYDYTIAISPDQPVKRLTVDVHIVDQATIQFLRVPPFVTEQTNIASTHETQPGTNISISTNRRSAHVRFAPTITQQTEFSPLGLSGAFRIEYDVDREQMYGDIVASNGYFVHFFAAPTLPPMPKVIVFVIDVSGSMYGHKMAQMRQAMTSVLNNLNKDDFFNLIFFGNEAEPWIHDVMSPATPASVKNAISYFEDFEARGGTNMMAAFESAFRLLQPFLTKLPGDSSGLSRRIRKREAGIDTDVLGMVKMIVFMTDGRATVGEINPDVITERVQGLNNGRVNIHTLGFGPLVDAKFLTKLANLNNGASRRVLESLDAAVQIYKFLDEVTNPLMSDISMTYPPNKVKDLTLDSFDILSAGSELVLAGKFEDLSRWESASNTSSEQAVTVESDELLRFRRQSGGPELVPSGRLVHGQIRGRSVLRDIEMDFDINPDAPSSIDRSNHKIEKFTERLWAFLHIKSLMSQASIANDSAQKAMFEEMALNTSLRYQFVTPLTSMVVLRSEDRKRIEKELRKEERQRIKEEVTRAEEEREEAKKVTDFETLARAHEEDLVFDPKYSLSSIRRTSGGRSGGFYGDPHFVIPLNDDVRLCFNWDGKDGEIYNLLYDRISGITVNGRLITSPGPDDAHLRSFMSTLYVTIPEKSFSLLVNPRNVTFVNGRMKNITLPVTTPMSLRRNGIRMQIYEVRRASARIYIATDDLVFQIKLVRNTRSKHRRDHLDFSVSRNRAGSTESRDDGVIGQFLSTRVNLMQGQENEKSFIEIDGRFGRVELSTKKNPADSRPVTCWFSSHNARDLIRGTHERYLVNGMMESPGY